ncbi:hypothetical protein [Paenibacillus mucilaginosus]|uniref:hypothetical protein n=1 Tax=Paenibacillus mucilaginosus TaxID=61624 RepID=UPI003D1AFA83
MEPSDQAAGLHSDVSLFQPAGGGSGQHSGIQSPPSVGVPRIRQRCRPLRRCESIRGHTPPEPFADLLFVVSSQPGQIRL